MSQHAELIRPFAVANGRTVPRRTIDDDTLLRTSLSGLAALASLSPFAQRILVAATAPIRAGDLADSLVVVKAAASVVLADLVHEGYLESHGGLEDTPSVMALVKRLQKAAVLTL